MPPNAVPGRRTGRWRGRRLGRWLLAAAAAVAVAAPAAARAESLSGISGQLSAADSAADALGRGIKRPDQAIGGPAEMARRVVDAQVAFRLGRYDDTAILLYDVIGQGKGGRDYDTALYYTGEALYQRGDKGGARTYFQQLVTDAPGSSYYQRSLERLIELSLELNDPTGVDDWLAALDQVPAAQRDASVPYVRGKYAFSLGHFDEALHWFAEVPADSDLAFQAAYLTGTTYVSQKDLGKATQVFADVIQKTPKLPADRRVIELAQLALGRLYYERDQPSKAIDAYLLIDRKSDLFDDALYEVAWVYVKGKQYDKALRALELLALTDPSSQKLPTVQLLEGNLRIRKAQTIHDQQIQGVFTGRADPDTEYGEAEKIFKKTHSDYAPAYDQLAALVARNADPSQFLAQITRRNSRAFQVNATMPEVAASWLREQPDVQRVIAIETDLGDIQSNIDTAERYVERLDAVLSSPDKTAAFPTLAERRGKIRETRDQVLELRAQLADEEYDLVRKANPTGAAGLEAAHQARSQAQDRVDQVPVQRASAIEKLTALHNQLDGYEQQLSEAQVVLDSVNATSAAIRKYMSDEHDQVAAQLRDNTEESLSDMGPDVDEIQDQIDAIRRDITLARDQIVIGDPMAEEARDRGRKLDAALDAEHAAAAGALGSGDRQRAATIAGLIDQAKRVLAKLDADDGAVDTVAAAALGAVKADLDRQKAALADYRSRYQAAELASRDVGGAVLGQSFRDVKTKFYDVVVRADVGVVDVSWSRKEASDDELKRLNLEKQREVKQIRDEFREVLQDQESAPAPAPPPTPPPASTDGAPAGDTGAGGTR
jgi:tetratricopeptide (TPR) repeat protein